MRIKLHSNYASPTGSGRPGDIIKVDKTVGKALIADGYASHIGDNRPRTTPSAAKASPGSGNDGPEVPNGKAQAVIDWIGDDPSRAKAALEAENAARRPRKTVKAAAAAILEATT